MQRFVFSCKTVLVYLRLRDCATNRVRLNYTLSLHEVNTIDALHFMHAVVWYVSNPTHTQSSAHADTYSIIHTHVDGGVDISGIQWKLWVISISPGLRNTRVSRSRLCEHALKQQHANTGYYSLTDSSVSGSMRACLTAWCKVSQFSHVIRSPEGNWRRWRIPSRRTYHKKNTQQRWNMET